MCQKIQPVCLGQLFLPTPRVYTDGLSYAEVITKFSGIDRFPFSFRHGAPLQVLCTHVHSTIKWPLETWSYSWRKSGNLRPQNSERQCTSFVLVGKTWHCRNCNSEIVHNKFFLWSYSQEYNRVSRENSLIQQEKNKRKTSRQDSTLSFCPFLVTQWPGTMIMLQICK